MNHYSKTHCEYLRTLANQRFDLIRPTWVDCGLWAAPHRTKWLTFQKEGARNNRHVVDPTHILSIRSFVAGFMEGNTSATRPWYRNLASNPDLNEVPENRLWLQKYTNRQHAILNVTNFYNAAGQVYYDYGVFNTACYYIEEMKGRIFFHVLTPGSYKVINDAYGVAVILVREFSLTVKAIVDRYGKKKNGKWDWSNFSNQVRKLFEDGNYTERVMCAQIVEENPDFNPEKPQALHNRQWISKTYEIVGNLAYVPGSTFNPDGAGVDPTTDQDKYLEVLASRRKPFIVPRSQSSNNYEYGETGPTVDALGLIRSLQKKAIGKDQALEQILRPAMQGPANLRKSYMTTAPNSFIPLDINSMANKHGVRPVFEVNPAIGPLIQDVTDLRQMIDRLYYADYLLYLTKNPKTRTAAETNAVVEEQQRIIGPNLQSLNWTHNVPIVDFIADWVLYEDPFLEPPPEGLQGQTLRTDFISVFAQAQKAADLPSVDRYIAMISQVGSIRPEIFDKANLDKLADIYEDRLYLPAGLNNPQAKVDAMREAAQQQAQRQQALTQTIPALAGAAKDVGMKVGQGQQGPAQGQQQ